MSDDADVLLNKAVEAIRALMELDLASQHEPWVEHERQSEFVSKLESEIAELRSSWEPDDDFLKYDDVYEPPGAETEEVVKDGCPCIVVVGNPVDGLTLVGPFSSFDTANEYGDLLKDVWFCTKLEAPSDFNPAWTDENSPHGSIDYGELF